MHAFPHHPHAPATGAVALIALDSSKNNLKQKELPVFVEALSQLTDSSCLPLVVHVVCTPAGASPFAGACIRARFSTSPARTCYGRCGAHFARQFETRFKIKKTPSFSGSPKPTDRLELSPSGRARRVHSRRGVSIRWRVHPCTLFHITRTHLLRALWRSFR